MPENFQLLLLELLPKQQFSEVMQSTIALLVMLVVGYSFYFIAKRYFLPWIKEVVAFFKPDFAKSIEKPMRQINSKAALLGPVVFYLTTYQWFVPDTVWFFVILTKCLYVCMYITVALLVSSILNIITILYNQQAFAKEVPIKGIIQIIKLAIFIVFSVLSISELIGKEPWYLLSGLGALTAVLLLVFKDTIMGLVAGVQIASNRLVAHGDWIEMPQHGVDGDVLEVGLHTVKVQNWDKTIATIPTYKLISESFKNWRGMSESGGRRIKRSFLIDINSIVFVDKPQRAELLKTLKENGFTHCLEEEGCNETNLGMFRQYCEYYLKQHEKINQEMTLMARLLPPSEYGVALEIYCFSGDKRWTEYEKIQACVLEHLLARLQPFGLKAFQRPSDRLN